MSPRPTIPEERVEQILNAAVTVFAREGFAKTRMDDIAEEAGLSKGTLYLYFESKDSLITAILEQFFNSAFQDSQQLIETDAPTSERLILLVEHLTSDVEEMAALASIGFEFYASAARQVSVREFLRKYFHEYTNLIATLIQQGIDREEFHPVNVREAALTIVSLFEGLNLLHVLDHETIPFREQGVAAIHLILNGLLA